MVDKREFKRWKEGDKEDRARLRMEKGLFTKGVVRLTFYSGEWSIAAHPYVAFRARASSVLTHPSPEFQLTVGFQTRSSVVIPRVAMKPVREQSAPDTAARKGERWETFCFDLRDLLRQKLSPAELRSESIREFALMPAEAARYTPITVRDFFVFADWQTKDVVKVDAFDASGVAGVVAGSGALTKELALAPATVPAADIQDGWLMLRVRDRAGNTSDPIRIPFAPSSPREPVKSPGPTTVARR
jgi:hypothetical protein